MNNANIDKHWNTSECNELLKEESVRNESSFKMVPDICSRELEGGATKGSTVYALGVRKLMNANCDLVYG